MRKGFSVLLALVIAISLSMPSVLAADQTEKETAKEAHTAASTEHGKKQTDLQKQFRTELNEQKKELQQQKSVLNQEKEALMEQYEEALAAGDEAGADSFLEQIQAKDEEIAQLQSQIKQAINERYMVVKTMYSEEELAQFESASDLIAQMYADAEVLSVGCVTVNNNLVKFDAPAYIKGGVTLVPLRAISEELGAEVSWDSETQTVTIEKDDTIIQITANSTTALVNGEPVELSQPAVTNCGRTYLPVRFLAETLGLTVTWDGENELIDIDGTETPDPDDDSNPDPEEEPAPDPAPETTPDATTEE